MTNIHEQRIDIKFHVKLSKSFIEIHKIMQNACGDQYLGCTLCYDGLKRFKDGRMSVDDIQDVHQKSMKLCILIDI